jgi:hypothetical protein
MPAGYHPKIGGWCVVSGSHLSLIVMPIVIAVLLTVWLSAVFYANAHPGKGRSSVELKTEVRGGSFQAVEGGRQLEPIPGHRPAVPGQRVAATSETYRAPSEPSSAREDDESRRLAGQGRPPV